MVEKSKLDEDPQGKVVDPTRYRRMIGTLMYVISSRPNLVFVVCMCAWYQEKPTKKNLHTVKRIFRYLIGTINIGLWYSKDSCIALTAFVDDDHVGCQDSRKDSCIALTAFVDDNHAGCQDSRKVNHLLVQVYPSFTLFLCLPELSKSSAGTSISVVYVISMPTGA
nr:retrovirus-related Pol polyprotein from transposon TNT 1-94 [Tanacetum cinerariifolium]